jgi:hypothetical protein
MHTTTELFCMGTKLQYVNDNSYVKEMKNGTAFKCDGEGGEGTLLFMCKASGKGKKKVGFLAPNDEVRCAGRRL